MFNACTLSYKELEVQAHSNNGCFDEGSHNRQSRCTRPFPRGCDTSLLMQQSGGTAPLIGRNLKISMNI